MGDVAGVVVADEWLSWCCGCTSNCARVGGNGATGLDEEEDDVAVVELEVERKARAVDMAEEIDCLDFEPFFLKAERRPRRCFDFDM